VLKRCLYTVEVHGISSIIDFPLIFVLVFSDLSCFFFGFFFPFKSQTGNTGTSVDHSVSICVKVHSKLK
jgi:hypothetical protein